MQKCFHLFFLCSNESTKDLDKKDVEESKSSAPLPSFGSKGAYNKSSQFDQVCVVVVILFLKNIFFPLSKHMPDV